MNVVFGPCASSSTLLYMNRSSTPPYFSVTTSCYAASPSAFFAFGTFSTSKPSDPRTTTPQISCSASSFSHSAVWIRTRFSFPHSGSPVPIGSGKSLSKSMGGKGGAMSSRCSLTLTNNALRWLLTVSAASLLLQRDNGIYKQLLVPILALQLPHEMVAWCRGEYGVWTAFLATLVRLFYHIPGDLELPLILLVLLITSPTQAAQLRGTLAGTVISVTLAGYVAFQHFSSMRGVQDAFSRQIVVTTVAAILVVSILLVFLFRGV